MTIKRGRYPANLSTGEACVVHIDEDGPKLEIDRVHAHPREFFQGLDMPERMVIALQGGGVMTMTGLYRVHRTATFISSYEEYRSNLAIAGPAELSEATKIKSLTFSPSNPELSVMYRGHRLSRHVNDDNLTIRDLSGSVQSGTQYIVDVIDHNRCEAFSSSATNLTVSGHVLISTNSNIMGQSVKENRNVKISYHDFTNIYSSIQDMICVCDFFTLLVGEVVSPIEVELTCEGQPDRWGNLPNFTVFARWREQGRPIDPQHGRRCLISPMFDSGVYERSLATWMDRRQNWGQSYALGTTCTQNQHEISRRRFLDAATWFESIPTSFESQRTKIPKRVLEEAADAASSAFSDRGESISAGRIKALLGPLNSPSLSDKVNDALLRSRIYMGADLIPDRLDQLASFLPRIRGRFAHGEDAFLSNLGHLVHEATLLYETIAYALTIEGLGFHIKPESQGHPLLSTIRVLQQFAGEPPNQS